MIAIREAWIAGLFSKKHWANNVIAGVIVGVVALPLALAFAIASGATPEQRDPYRDSGRVGCVAIWR